MFTDFTSSGGSRARLASRPRVLDAIGGTVTAAMLIATAWLIAGPLRGERRNLIDEAAGHRAYLATAPEIQSAYRETHRQHTAQLQRVATLTERVPATPNEAAFLGQLSALAQQCGLELQEFEPAEAIERGTHWTIPIRVVARATYESTCRFLNGMDELPRLFDVARFSLISSDTNGVGNRLRVEMELHVYYQPGTMNFAEIPTNADPLAR